MRAYIAEFSTVSEQKEGQAPKVKHVGSVRFLVNDDYDGSLAAIAYRRANRDQLNCELVKIYRDN